MLLKKRELKKQIKKVLEEHRIRSLEKMAVCYWLELDTEEGEEVLKLAIDIYKYEDDEDCETSVYIETDITGNEAIEVDEKDPKLIRFMDETVGWLKNNYYCKIKFNREIGHI